MRTSAPQAPAAPAPRSRPRGLDVVFESGAASERRLPALRHAYLYGSAHVATGAAQA